MSCSRGNTARNRPQKHQNRTAFKNDLHDKSKKTKTINKLEITGLCDRCKDIIEWKIKYKKYKPLTAPSKCVQCSEKTVKFAYHMICGNCAADKHLCAKCMKVPVIVSKSPILSDCFETNSLLESISEFTPPKEDLQTILKNLPERKRRSLLRYIKKQGSGDQMTPEIMSYLKELMTANEGASVHLSSEGFSDDYCSNSDEEYK